MVELNLTSPIQTFTSFGQNENVQSNCKSKHMVLVHIKIVLEHFVKLQIF